MYFKLTTLLLLITFNINAQWYLQNPYPTGNLTHMGAATSADKYLVVSSQGDVIYTTDGGVTFTILPINTTRILRAMYFIDENIGFIGGASEAFFKTTNGGLSWDFISNAPDTIKYDIHFVNNNLGWATGFRGLIIKSTDGGNSWFSQSITHLTTSTMYGIYAVDANNVFAAGNANSFFRTTNSGELWTAIPPIWGTSTDLREVKFTSATNGFVIGHRNRIARTTDGGNTWTSVYDGGTTNVLWSMGFNSTGTTGIVAGGGSIVLRTTNSGASWTQVTGFPASITFYSARFATDNIVYISGSGGNFFKSTDGGATFTQLGYRFTATRIRDVAFANNDVGYVVGTNFLAKSTNGGYEWTEFTSPFTGDINEVVAPTPNLVIAGADLGNVVRTSDGGATWNVIATGITGTNSDILAIDFINENIGLAVGYNGTVARSTDGGLTWSLIGTITGGNPWDMDMVTETHAWVSATGERIFKTSDGGVTWVQQLQVGGLGTYGISFIDTLNGVAGGTGGNTYYTGNGGETWLPAETKPAQTVWGIHMAPSPVYGSVAMTACASGYVYKSTDGGRNWSAEPRFTISTMDDVFMTDAANAWFVGSSGLILKYTNPANIPVELNSFTANISGNNVILNWTTASETNNLGFEVQKSEVGIQNSEWEVIGFVEGNGTTTKLNNYSFTNNNLINGKTSYRLKQIDLDGSFEYSNEVEVEIGLPNEFVLLQNYPNPFNPLTVIQYVIASDKGTKQSVTLKVYDILGNEVATLVNEEKEAGYYSVSFNPTGLSSGIYIYQIRAGSFIESKRMLLLK